MTPIQTQIVSGATPATMQPAAASAPSGQFADLLRELEHASDAPATPEQLGSTLAAADDAFELAMRLRVQLEQAYAKAGGR